MGMVSLSIFTSSSGPPIYISTYNKSEDERRRQIHVQRERRGPLNPRRRDDDAGSSTAPTDFPSPSTAPI
ncbi:hypothetical protein J1N35_009977 [Gossypium stocksii]|uniref:Uncharacterized protein n=1 Tax=Gossypium stocksii TaxID=47602 RepID=A0A9D3VZM3_9ROSI|nr:hypothetical protein J1N35_009977 [Gossypium stocksii]